MSKSDRKRAGRQRLRRAAKRHSRTVPVVVALILATGLLLVLARSTSATHHPEPRAGITAEQVVVPIGFSAASQVGQVYRAAAQIPALLDGLYCYCSCRENLGHRSLLTCFETGHAAGCDICLGEADLAARLAIRGATLPQIRAKIDRSYGRRG